MENSLNKQVKTRWWAWVLLIIIFCIFIALKNDSLINSSTSNSNSIATIKQEWVKVTSITTSTKKQSDTFHLNGGKQRITYILSGKEFSSCYVYIVPEGKSLDKEGGFPVAIATGKTNDETMTRESAGNYYLDLSLANGVCSVLIEELR